jgi:hypothetical protein
MADDALVITPFPDGTGEIGVAPGWIAQSLGQGNAVLIGPDGARVEIGIFVSVLDPRGILAQQKASMGLPPTGLQLQCVSDPGEALVAVTRAMSEQRGQGDPHMRVEAAEPQPSAPGTRTAGLRGTYLVGGVAWRFGALVTANPPNAVGSWSIGGNIWSAPDATFARDEPAMLAMANSMVLDVEARRKQLGLPEGWAAAPPASAASSTASAPPVASALPAASLVQAATSAPGATVPLTVTPFPDGTGHIGIAEGWIATRLGEGCAVLVRPDGAQVSMGVSVRALDPRGSAYQMQRQMGAMGMPPPAAGLVLQYVPDAAHAFVAVNSALMMQGGQPDPEMRIVDANPVAAPPGAMGALVTATYRKDGVARRVRGIVMLYAPMQNGFWMVSGNLASAPDATYDADEPTLLAMFNSFAIDHEAIGKQIGATTAAVTAGGGLSTDQQAIIARGKADRDRVRGMAAKSTNDFIAGMFHSD